jgi:hypothetical protein
MAGVESLHIGSTKSTPEVHFDAAAHRLAIVGESYPENAFKFYEPIFAWVDRYLLEVSADTEVLVSLELPYINTSSTKCLMMLLDKLDQAYGSGQQIRLEWYCNEENDSELECAEEFKEDMSMPFHILMKKEV